MDNFGCFVNRKKGIKMVNDNEVRIRQIETELFDIEKIERRRLIINIL